MSPLNFFYRYRPGYGSTNYLIEINLPGDEESFKLILTTLENIKPSIVEITDLWQNDEILFLIKSNEGEFIISKDIWGFVFIMAENNQQVLTIIDSILSESPLFTKEEVDPTDYQLRS